MISFDVVIPTGGSPTNLQSILNLHAPEGTMLNFFVVTDKPPATFAAAKGANVKVVQSGGAGASAARNAGVEAGSGDYILFIDDDVIPSPSLIESYRLAIERWPDAVGFVGLTRLPDPVNSFERGVVASDILTFQGIAKTHQTVSWGVTANLLVRRVAMGPVRFSQDFPRHGGGEDIDFCLRIVKHTGKRFLSVPEAVVEHPWWHNGSRQYKRFARWAYGDSRLPAMYKEYRYRNFPNMSEAAVLGALAFAVAGVLEPRLIYGVGYAILAACLIEFAADSIRCHRRGMGSGRTGVEAALVRLSNELGRVAGNLSRGHVAGFSERFDYFTTGESIAYERRAAAGKLLVFVVGLSIFLLILVHG